MNFRDSNFLLFSKAVCQIMSGRGYTMEEQNILFLLRVEIKEITTSGSVLYGAKWFSTGYCHQHFCQINDWHSWEQLCHSNSLKQIESEAMNNVHLSTMKRWKGGDYPCVHRHFIRHFHPNNAESLTLSFILSLPLLIRLGWDTLSSC